MTSHATFSPYVYQQSRIPSLDFSPMHISAYKTHIHFEWSNLLLNFKHTSNFKMIQTLLTQIWMLRDKGGLTNSCTSFLLDDCNLASKALHYIWYLRSPIVINLLITYYKPMDSVGDVKWTHNIIYHSLSFCCNCRINVSPLLSLTQWLSIQKSIIHATFSPHVADNKREGLGQYMNSSIIHDIICSLIHKKCQPKFTIVISYDTIEHI